MKRVITVAVLGCLVLVVAALQAAGRGDAPSRADQADQSAQVGAAISQFSNRVPDIPIGRGIVSAVTMRSATTDPGSQVSANGTLTMPPGEAGDVAISVSWIDPLTSSVYARGLVTLRDVRPAEQRNWQVLADLPADAAGTTTVLGAVIVDTTS
ncbi:MAG: hypothetical protein LBH48_03250 [Bifidobacteriaceae bacterium]|jgi:hypothetical protein|nr:hypothetical protein [Bifidobacteriaceae bacterium]